MQTRRIGSLEATLVGIGCNNFGWRIDEQATAAVVDAALDAGITFFDTADSYGRGLSEEYLGRALRGRRHQVVIATKFGSDMGDGRRGARAAYVRQACEDSLRRLGTDYIDLYQLHRPDPETPIAETLGALDALVKAGKVREIGCSNFTVALLRDAAAAPPGAARFASLQNEYSLLERGAEQDVLPECERTGLAFLPYYPLASGLLTGKYRAGQPLPEGTRLTDGGYFARQFSEERLALAESLARFAELRGHTLLELAFAWLLARPVVASVIAGATRPEQVRANAAAVSWTLTAADLEEIDALLAAGEARR
jgi:aryl-alcohol dehydrogenase-like predicted oxidoreductase